MGHRHSRIPRLAALAPEHLAVSQLPRPLHPPHAVLRNHFMFDSPCMQQALAHSTPEANITTACSSSWETPQIAPRLRHLRIDTQHSS